MARLGPAKLSCKTKGKAIKIFRFADDIDGLAGEEEELAKLVERLDKASTAYGMEIRPSTGFGMQLCGQP